MLPLKLVEVRQGLGGGVCALAARGIGIDPLGAQGGQLLQSCLSLVRHNVVSSSSSSGCKRAHCTTRDQQITEQPCLELIPVLSCYSARDPARSTRPDDLVLNICYGRRARRHRYARQSRDEQKVSADSVWIFLLAVPPGLVALAVALDRRSGRGYGLGFLAMVALVLDIWGIVSIAQAEQRVFASHTDNLDFGIVVAVYFLIGLYLALALVFGGIVETAISRQWRWLALIAALSF